MTRSRREMFSNPEAQLKAFENAACERFPQPVNGEPFEDVGLIDDTKKGWVWMAARRIHSTNRNTPGK